MKINLHFQRTILFSLLFLTVAACTESQTVAKQESTEQLYQYKMPPLLDDGWQVGHLSDHYLDETLITNLIINIKNGYHPGIDSLSIVRNNHLLLHENFRKSLTKYDQWVGNDELERHLMHSVSKSYMSALVGIAFQQGFLNDVSAPIYELFDYPSYQNWHPQKESITLENVLTMQLGLEWDEWNHPFGSEANSLTKLTEHNNDFVKALLDLPLITEPGTEFRYNTVASIALGLLVEHKTGMPLEDYAQQFLFTPLQIKNTDWLMTPTGIPNAGSGLIMQTRDMAKLGQLYLNKGQWNGFQLVNEKWIENSLKSYVEVHSNYTNGYGYQWWIGEFSNDKKTIPFYSSRGSGGQFIIIIPEYELVIAFTANNYDNDLYESPLTLVENYIIPAIR